MNSLIMNKHVIQKEIKHSEKGLKKKKIEEPDLH